MSSSREQILNAVKQALKTPSHLPVIPDGIDEKIKTSLAGITPKVVNGMREQFAHELVTISGEFVHVHNDDELANQISSDITTHGYESLATTGTPAMKAIAQNIKNLTPGLECVHALDYQAEERKEKLAVTKTAVVTVNYGVADIASLAVFIDDAFSLFPYYLPDVVYVILKAEQVKANLFELFAEIPADKAKNMVLITGPSRTADIEKILILGAHGPRRLVVYWIQA